MAGRNATGFSVFGAGTEGQDNEAFDLNEISSEESSSEDSTHLFSPRTPQNDNNESDEEEIYAWDPFREIHDDVDVYDCTKCFEVSKRIFKFLFIVIVSLSVLGCLSASKVLLLFMTTSINPYMFFRETKEGVDFHQNSTYTTCGVPTCLTYTAQDVPIQNVRWVWGLHLAAIVPYVFCLVKGLWKIVLKRKRTPTLKTVIVELVIESIHSIGLFILVFVGLPLLDAPRAVLVMCALGIVPSVLSAIQSSSTNGIRLLNCLFAIAQIGAFIAWFVRIIIEPIEHGDSTSNYTDSNLQELCENINNTFYETFTSYKQESYSKFQPELELLSGDTEATTDANWDFTFDWTNAYMTSKPTTTETTTTPTPILRKEYFAVEYLPETYYDYWPIVVGSLCVSIVWWQNFITKFSTEKLIKANYALRWYDKIALSMNMHKLRVQRSRTKISVLICFWKIVLSSGLILVFYSITYFPWGVGFGDLFESKNFYSRDTLDGNIQYDWLILFATQSLCGLVARYLMTLAVRSSVQIPCIAMPIVLCTPVSFGVVVWACYECDGFWSIGAADNLFWNCFAGHQSVLDVLLNRWGILGVVLWLSEVWTVRYLFHPSVERLAKSEKIFLQPFHCSLTLEQSLAFNRRSRDEDYQTVEKKLLPEFNHEPDDIIQPSKLQFHDDSEDIVPLIYCCATMWHENEAEMVQILKSFFRLDQDNHACKMAKQFFKVKPKDYFEFEVHILFDDAFEPHTENDTTFVVNSFVKQFCRLVSEAAFSVHRVQIAGLDCPEKIETPYGGKLKYTFPGGNKMTIHLKDKVKVRHKKRWSQVMYMFYLLGKNIWARTDISNAQKQKIAENTFILALDGDVDFKPDSVRLLLDLMKKDLNVAASCGRIHPIGAGPMVWYQKFEYAIGHWLGKSTEHVLGCVLCSPGCFSLFRGSALMDDNVVKTYARKSNEAIHYVQYDQGEDRWLCTLLLQQGFRVEYTAAADALTYAPEGFSEFFNQRRRWTPSTFANILDLLTSAGRTVDKNENISTLYMIYQGSLLVSAILGPATIFLLIVNSLNIAIGIGKTWSLILVIAPLAVFIIICLVAKPATQISAAAVLSTLMAIVQMIVLVGILRQVVGDGLCHPNTWLLIFMVATFLVAGMFHPQEFTNLIHGFLYYLAIPTMYLILIIYSICNLNVVSWGTREVVKTEAEKEKERIIQEVKDQSAKDQMMRMLPKSVQIKKDKTGVPINCGSLCHCLCCLKDGRSDEAIQMEAIHKDLANISKQMQTLLEERCEEEEGVNEDQSGNSEVPVTDQPENSQSLNSVSDTQSEDESTGESSNDFLSSSDLNEEAEEKKINWVSDPDIGKGKIKHLDTEEKEFWGKFIAKYLYPLTTVSDEQDKVALQLRELRNKSVFAFIMIDVLLIALMETISLSIGSDQSLSITWNCTDPITNKVGVMELDPLAIMFIIVFGIIIAIQFVCMFGHRLMTWLQIVSTTPLCTRETKKGNIPGDDWSTGEAIEYAKVLADLEKDTTSLDSTTISRKVNDWIEDELDQRTPLAFKLRTNKHKKRTTASLSKVFAERYLALKSIADTMSDRYNSDVTSIPSRMYKSPQSIKGLGASIALRNRRKYLTHDMAEQLRQEQSVDDSNIAHYRREMLHTLYEINPDYNTTHRRNSARLKIWANGENQNSYF